MAEGPTPAEVEAYLKKHELQSLMEGAANAAVQHRAADPFEHIARVVMPARAAVLPPVEKLPKAEVEAYLARHQLLSAIEQAINDACFHLADDPRWHIGQYLLQWRKPESASADGEVATAKRASSAAARLPEDEPSPKLKAATDKIFAAMDANGDGSITPDEAAQFFKSFGKLNAGAMFNEVDVNSDGDITLVEWDGFWRNVKASGYSEEDMLEELEAMASGDSWVDFDDGRDVAPATPKMETEAAASERASERKPSVLAIASKQLKAATDKIFAAMDANGDGSITPDEAAQFFKSFGKLNAGAMFNEVDVNSDGDVTMKEWDGFWRNVKASGYSEEDMLEELEAMASGDSWVDFDDGRDTADKPQEGGRKGSTMAAGSAPPTLQLARKGSKAPA